jgi:hypothetical protein
VSKTEEPDVVDATAEEEPQAAPGELIARADVDGDVYRIMDAYDSEQVLAELEGRPSEVMIYSFGSGGNRKTGLSWKGAAECVRTMNANRYAQIKVAKEIAPIFEEIQEENEDGNTITYVQATVYAEDALNGGGNWGTARQQKFMVYNQERNPGKKPTIDPFARAKALSKAQRNAMEPLVPLSFVEALIALHIGNKNRVKEIRVGLGHATAELPPPLVDEAATELKNACRGVYADIRKLDPMALPPGRFNVKLRRAEVEHKALEELLEELRSMLQHLAGEAGTT